MCNIKKTTIENTLQTRKDGGNRRCNFVYVSNMTGKFYFKHFNYSTYKW